MTESRSSTLTLQRYFDGSFQILQQEVALFIKGFPIINMEEISSLNTLITLLIKQNSMLGSRLRDQISQIKENYKRSEGAISDTKKYYEDREREAGKREKGKERELEEVREEMKEMKRREGECEREIERLRAEVKGSVKQNPELTQQVESSVIGLRNRFYGLMNEVVENKFSKSLEMMEAGVPEMSELLAELYHIVSNGSKAHYSNFVKDSKQSCVEIVEKVEEKIRAEKGRSKSEKQKYLWLVSVVDNIRQSVREYSIKLKETVRILKLASHSVDTKPILQGFEGEAEGLLGKVESIRESVQEPSGRKSIDVSHLSESRKERHSFQSMLMRVVESLEKQSSKKAPVDYSKIKHTQKQLKKSLREVSESCKQQLDEFSNYLLSNTVKITEQLRINQELHDEYQRSLRQSRGSQDESRRRIDEISNTNLQLNRMLMEKSSKVLEYQQVVGELQGVVDRLEKKVVETEREKYYVQERLEESVLGVATPLKQELIRLRAETEDDKNRFYLEKQDLLISLNTQKKKTEQLLFNLCESKEDKSRLSEKLALQSQQTIELSRMLSLKDKQIDSLGDLIRQLQTKVRCQSIDLRGKEFQLTENEAKMKELVQDNQINMTQLKQIKQDLPIVIELNEHVAVLDRRLLQLSEENLKLKMLLKESKVEVVNSRRAVMELSEMKGDYERMKSGSEFSEGELERVKGRLRESEEGEGRLKINNQKLGKRVDELEKYHMETLTLQAENNRLLIEVRHMKNVLARISEIKDFL